MKMKNILTALNEEFIVKEKYLKENQKRKSPSYVILFLKLFMRTYVESLIECTVIDNYHFCSFFVLLEYKKFNLIEKKSNFNVQNV